MTSETCVAKNMQIRFRNRDEEAQNKPHPEHVFHAVAAGQAFPEEFSDWCNADVHTEQEDRQANDDQKCTEQETLQIDRFERRHREMKQDDKQGDRQHGLQNFPHFFSKYTHIFNPFMVML